MTDFVDYLIVTLDDEPSFDTARRWFQGEGMDFSRAMRANPTPRTITDGTGSGGGRPSVGLVWPH